MTMPVPLSLLSPLSPFSYNHSPSPVAEKCHHLSPLSPGQRANGFGGTGGRCQGDRRQLVTASGKW